MRFHDITRRDPEWSYVAVTCIFGRLTALGIAWILRSLAASLAASNLAAHRMPVPRRGTDGLCLGYGT
jgi:hypothetical protein